MEEVKSVQLIVLLQMSAAAFWDDNFLKKLWMHQVKS